MYCFYGLGRPLFYWEFKEFGKCKQKHKKERKKRFDILSTIEPFYFKRMTSSKVRFLLPFSAFIFIFISILHFQNTIKPERTFEQRPFVHNVLNFQGMFTVYLNKRLPS
jgi:hypothetical protein